jgi:hypothetical protein
VRSLIRTLCVWLLVLAVPAQNVAAATMAYCGTKHHAGAAPALVQHAAPTQHAHHGSNAAVNAHAHHDMAAHGDVGEAASADDATPAKTSGIGQHACSACASCCSAGAIFDTVLAVPTPIVAPMVFSAVVPSVDPFATAGPDRPPRPVLA